MAAEGTAPSGKPSVETTTWYLVPSLPRSVGLGPVNSPPRLARTEQLSTTTSHAMASGPARTIRIRTMWTWRSRAVALQASRRRRRVEPHARPTVARSSRHCTPSRRKYRSVSTTLTVGRGRPSRGGRPALDAVDDRRHELHCRPCHARLPAPEAWETDAWPVAADGLRILPAFWKPALSLGGASWIRTHDASLVSH